MVAGECSQSSIDRESYFSGRNNHAFPYFFLDAPQNIYSVWLTGDVMMLRHTQPTIGIIVALNPTLGSAAMKQSTAALANRAMSI